MSIFYIILIILFTFFLIYIAYNFYKKTNKEIHNKENSFLENKEFLHGTKVTSGLYLFYTNWCPHCKDTLQVWNKISKDPVFNKYINFVKINCENKKNKAYEDEFKITEYPTIILVYKNKKYYFDANLEEEILKRFLTHVYKNN